MDHTWKLARCGAEKHQGQEKSLSVDGQSALTEGVVVVEDERLSIILEPTLCFYWNQWLTEAVLSISIITVVGSSGTNT